MSKKELKKKLLELCRHYSGDGIMLEELMRGFAELYGWGELAETFEMSRMRVKMILNGQEDFPAWSDKAYLAMHRTHIRLLTEKEWRLKSPC